ncbi:MAG: hypothetical protein O3B25_16165 [Verrucomicrobia bacterium]|nr:hypothetical protein [Verrucomicrobiota bacterium]
MTIGAYFVCLSSFAAFVVAGLAAAEPMLAIPGKVLYQNKFDKALGKPWKAAKIRNNSVHHPAKAKRCIFLMMEEGPSPLDTFDPSPS